jgi:putative redox protein
MADVKKVAVRWIDGMEFETKTDSGHTSVIDASVRAGGKNHGPSPMELLLLGLAGCTGIDVVEILQKKRLDVTGVQVQVEGRRADTHPKVYTEIDVVYTIKGKDIPERAVEQAIHLSQEK